MCAGFPLEKSNYKNFFNSMSWKILEVKIEVQFEFVFGPGM